MDSGEGCPFPLETFTALRILSRPVVVEQSLFSSNVSWGHTIRSDRMEDGMKRERVTGRVGVGGLVLLLLGLSPVRRSVAL
jgi:hypothetical protein